MNHEQKTWVLNMQKIYEWEKTQLSGGQEVYQQVKVNKKAKKNVWSFYKPHQCLFNAFSNKWDLCQDFNFENKDGYDSDSDNDYNDQNYLEKFVSQSQSTFFAPSAAPMDKEEDTSPAPMYSQDVVGTLSLAYGYVPHLVGHGACLTLSWDAILKFLGFIKNLEELDIPEPEKSAMSDFFYSIVSGNDWGLDFEHLKQLFDFEQV